MTRLTERGEKSGQGFLAAGPFVLGTRSDSSDWPRGRASEQLRTCKLAGLVHGQRQVRIWLVGPTMQSTKQPSPDNMRLACLRVVRGCAAAVGRERESGGGYIWTE